MKYYLKFYMTSGQILYTHMTLDIGLSCNDIVELVSEYISMDEIFVYSDDTYKTIVNMKKVEAVEISEHPFPGVCI